MENNIVVKLVDVEKNYGDNRIVKKINLDVREGEFLTLLGPSGCGKTTMGRTILKLHPSNGGEIIFNGEDITNYNTKEMRPIRTKMQIIFHIL